MTVLIENNRMTKIPEMVDAPAGATKIDASGRALRPGLIDVNVEGNRPENPDLVADPNKFLP